jgi:UDP-2-acetamido-3-amino-2,3-dideoxy-glucuronate N-acetyltransferase
VGAGSVVNKDVPAYAMVVGVPMRIIGWMSKHGEKLNFDQDGYATCPNTGEKYQKTGSEQVIAL